MKVEGWIISFLVYLEIFLNQKIYSSIRKAKIKANGRKSKPEYKVNIDDKISILPLNNKPI